MKPARQQRGVALLTAVLIMALVATLTYSLEWSNGLDMRRTVVMLNRDQAVQVALGAESWMQSILRQDFQDSPSEDHLGEIWASDLPGLPIDGGEVFGKIEDLQGRFNLNNLVDVNGNIDQDAFDQFRRLLLILGLDERLAGLVADWIDADRQANIPDGAEDAIYTGFTPPYRAANQRLTSASEIGAVEGVDKAVLDVLLPHVVALPGFTGVNVNTATPAVLQSIHPDLTPGDVEGLMVEREEAGFTDIRRTFVPLIGEAAVNTLEETTSYFQLKVVVRIDTVRVTYFSLLHRGAQGEVVPIVRSLGTS